MPSLGTHLARAQAVADRLALPEIEADRGAYYLGSTAPDIRRLANVERSVTHFFDLDTLDAQDSLARMLAEHPALASGQVEASLRAFMAGYLAHLVLDESYIGDVYRPHFGVYSTINDDPRSDVWDRALQYEMDRRDRDDRARMDLVREALTSTGAVGGIPFLEDAHLLEWARRVDDVASRPADYARFAQTLTRHVGREAMGGADSIRDACANPAALIAKAYEVVSADRIARFIADADERAVERLRAYLR